MNHEYESWIMNTNHEYEYESWIWIWKHVLLQNIIKSNKDKKPNDNKNNNNICKQVSKHKIIYLHIEYKMHEIKDKKNIYIYNNDKMNFKKNIKNTQGITNWNQIIITWICIYIKTDIKNR